MTEILLNILIISIICCCIIDVSGFIESLENGLTKVLKMKTKARIPKPFGCSLCMTHWLSIGYILLLKEFSLMIYAYILIVSILTPVTTDIIILIRDLLQKAVISLGRLLHI